uniref:hypothetical protein n=1 Tax=Bradyrhizobium sp. (strain ORS 278) TaxID=114615 RepID=UPI001389DF9F|nr:hypothetical protein [Bradyrhizobium sp. ORS 278]
MAPALWQIWRELDPAFAKPRRTLRFDAEFNASISEARGFAGILRQHVNDDRRAAAVDDPRRAGHPRHHRP